MNTTKEHYEEYPARSNGARVGLIIGIIAILAIIAAFAFGFININQTRSGEAPTVSVSGGQAPAFDVDTAKVSVGSKDSSVKVPTISVGTKDEAVKVPTVDVQKAK